MQLLQIAQLLNVFLKQLLILFLAFAIRLHDRWPLAKVDLFTGRHAEVVGIDIHGLLSRLLDGGKTLAVGFVVVHPFMDAPARA